MKEENNGAPKNKWSRIFRKKWFFPAVYLTIAALLLSVVVWYQNIDNQVPDAQDDSELADESNPEFDEDAKTVLDQQEVIEMPVQDKDQAEIVTKFYDYSAEQDEQEAGLVLYNNRYYQSTGIDIASADDKAFDVVASLSGTVTEVKEDPLLGNVVVVSHENDVMTYYASLGEVDVKADSKVKQGDTIGQAGKNIFGKDKGTHVHFELRKDGQEVNPESFFNQPVSKLDSIKTDEEKEDAKQEDESTTESDADADKAEQDATEAEQDTGEGSEDIEVGPEQDEDVDKEKDLEEDKQDNKQEDESDAEDEEPSDETSESSASSASA